MKFSWLIYSGQVGVFVLAVAKNFMKRCIKKEEAVCLS